MRKISTYSTVLTSGGVTYATFEAGPKSEAFTAYLEKGYLYIVFAVPEFYMPEEREEITVIAIDPYSTYPLEDEMKFLCKVEDRDLKFNTIGYQNIELIDYTNRLLVFWKSRRVIGEIVATQVGILDED